MVMNREGGTKGILIILDYYCMYVCELAAVVVVVVVIVIAIVVVVVEI